ncbi:hypothetical protein E3E36_04895 [Thermococcus sp. M36]|uniref:hypothetical protein n=1 Tax=Thermococcus sp. M36 TaxID=1638261 RepID=UPI00143A4042|nr:hypothetical protein [Thermococcus sp. M36]NJE05489.1 hypothetical protein [Thermococcus sp. M36]
MRRLGVLVLAVLMILSQAAAVNAAPAPQNPQPFFKMDIVIRVSPASINGSNVWIGAFKIHAVLEDPYYRHYFESMAESNSTKAEEEFRAFVKSLIYDNLKDSFNEKLKALNMTAEIYVPKEGPVRVLDNWSALVSFSVTNFLVPDGVLFKFPIWGGMKFSIRGRVFDYSWDRLTVMLPKDYEVKDLVPAPDDFEGNVAVWENGYIFPLIELYNPLYSYIRFINSTRKQITLIYDPDNGYVQFNATFSGAKANDAVVDKLLSSFRSVMDTVSIDAEERNGSLVVIGVAVPKVAYRETRSEKVWEAMVKLPGRFDNITVMNGEYQLAPDNTVIIRVVEKKRWYLPYAAGGALVLLAVLAYMLSRKRGGGRRHLGPKGGGGLPRKEE